MPMNFRFSEAIKHFQNLHTTNKLDMLPLSQEKLEQQYFPILARVIH